MIIINTVVFNIDLVCYSKCTVAYGLLCM